MGHKTPQRWAEEPFLRMMWEEYLLCRAQQFVVITKAGKGGKEQQIPILYPTHIANWPHEGGLRDQPYIVAKIFAAFLQGEQRGCLRSLSR